MMLSIIVIVVVLVAVIALYVYNRLVRLRQTVKDAWSQIGIQLKRRHDLIPNLVTTAKRYLEHERDVLENVVRARSMAAGAGTARDAVKHESILSQAMGRLFAVMEAYPNLKGDETILTLMEDLRSTENRIGFARQHYNDTVREYNTGIEQFPNTVLAGMFNFNPEPYFEIDQAERKVPVVKF